MRRRMTAYAVAAVGTAALAVGVLQATAQATIPVPATTHAATVTATKQAAASAVSLSGWNLTLPVDSSGGSSGDAVTVSPAKLYSPYLTQSSSGALDFWAPADGAKVGISLHPRTELRGTGTFVLGKGSAGLQETTAVTRLPDNSHDIIIGQMFPSGSTPFAMLHYQSGKIYGYVHDESSDYVLLTGVPLGATFQASITASGDTVKFSASYNGHTASETTTGISSWIGDTMHFQAGDYQQDVPGSASSDGGRVTFSALCQYGVPGGGTCGSTGGGGGTSTFPSGYHQLAVRTSGLCLDVAGGSTANNAVVDQWTCKTTNTVNQEFEFLPGTGGYGELRNQNSGDDVVVQGASKTSGAGVIQYAPNGSANGLWLPVQQSDGTWRFRNQNSGLCLDQTATAQGARFDQRACASGTSANQDFATQ